MTPQYLRRLSALSGQLADNLMAAVLCAEEIRGVVREHVDDESAPRSFHAGSALTGRPERPVLNESTKRVDWKGKSAHLGHTLYFQILERIARRPNQYVTHQDLMRDVWENEELGVSTLRSVVRHLRQKLRDEDMHELARAIRGHNGRYILDL